MDTEILQQVLSILLPALATLIAGWFAVLGNKIKTAYEEKINTQIKKQVVQSTVEYVEQVYKAMGGEEKLQKAIEQATIILCEKGIIISEIELRMLIEAAVYGLKQGLNGESLNEPNTPSLYADPEEEEED